jgi:cytochrome bd-type quinol oxidase subunit 2
MSAAIFGRLVGALMPTIPFIIVGIVGVALSVSRRSELAKAARWLRLGSILIILNCIGSVAIQAYAALQDPSAGLPQNYAMTVAAGTSAIYAFNLMGLIFLLSATLSNRGKRDVGA